MPPKYLHNYLVKAFYSFRRALRCWPFVVWFAPAYVWYLMRRALGFKRRNIWLLSERGDEARDNAYHFFRYLSEQKNVGSLYFLLDKNSADLPKFVSSRSLVEPGSFFHILVLIECKLVAGTYIYSGIPGGKVASFLLPFLPKKVYVNLKHGIIKDKRVWSTRYVDIICAASRKEVDNFVYLTKESEEAVSLTGLCRFDGLVDISSMEERKIILVMPTFRRWLHREASVMGDGAVENSQYFKSWGRVLASDWLFDLAKSTGSRVVFYPHYRMQPYLNCFYSDGDLVVHADSRSYDIQDLLNRSSLLITDYSSVFFDFSYMRKPVVYYQFDSDEFRRGHYSEGSFDYVSDGFGPVCQVEETLCEAVTKIAFQKYSIDNKYMSRVNCFFEFSDRMNCERVYQEAQRALREKNLA